MTKEQFIRNELYQLDIQKGSEAYDYILDNALASALAAATILDKAELRQLIEDYAEGFSFAQCGH
jgi:hypothetical protein